MSLPLKAVPGIPEIKLHLATPSSGVRHIVEAHAGGIPYWAYVWGGGLALARHILDQPACVAGKRVLDFGAGSGIVAIAAKLAGAAQVTAVDIDPLAVGAIALNAEANGVLVEVIVSDGFDGGTPYTDLILCGDVFYAPDVALRTSRFLERSRDSGTEVLIGDPGREDLPRDRLAMVARYNVGDFGSGISMGEGAIYEFKR